MSKKSINMDKLGYLSDFFDFLPSNCILNKGLTGCGGSYLELHSKRNSVILVPTIELVKNKTEEGIQPIYGGIKDSVIKKYLNSSIPYKKIIGTYDSIKRIINLLNPKDYFLLIDEYHILFNSYVFRESAIKDVLNHYTDFNEFCFMSATPLNDLCILKELEHLDQVTITWPNAVPVKIDIIDTYFTTNELFKLFIQQPNGNWHIFLNSVNTIRQIIPKLDDDYKVVCSAINKKKAQVKLNYGTTLDKPKKYNFYTSCSFEGCLLPEEKVLTNSGLKNAKDIALKDKLINKDGNLVDIINLQQYDKFNEDVYTLKLSNTYRTTTFTKIHPILTSKHPLKEKFIFKQCQNINKGEWTIYPNIYRKEIEIDLNDWNKFISQSNKDTINPILNEDFWWFIGLYLGDGWTQNDGYRVFISVNKNETITINRLESFCKLINRRYRIKKNSENCLEYIINCKQLVDFLNSNFGKYASGKYIPEKYKYIPHNLKIALINGYFDSDGCIIFSNLYKGTFVSINLKLLEDFQDIFTSLGLKTNLKLLRKAKKTKIQDKEANCLETYDLNISHNDLIKFYDMCIDKNFQKLSLIHLDKSLRNKRNPRFVGMDFSDDINYVYFKIKEINTFKYTGKVYNYECDTHTYVCRHITTHNCDLYDKEGRTVIICDTNIATTILDISTLIRQICGRLRDSVYKDEVTLILNTSKHRYAGVSLEAFKEFVINNISDGKRCEEQFKEFSIRDKNLELRKYSPETYNSFYANMYNNNIFYDDNLRKMDEYNYKLVGEIYNNSISVIKECNNIGLEASKTETKGEAWIREKLIKSEYTYEELESIFKPLFDEYGLVWNKNNSIDWYFPNHTKRRKTIQGKKYTVYKFY